MILRKVIGIFLLFSIVRCDYGYNDNARKREEARANAFGAGFAFGLINLSPDECITDKNRSTLIGTDFSATGTFTDTDKAVFYSIPEDATATHKFTLQTLSANCSSISIRFDICKYNRKKVSYTQDCNQPNSVAESGIGSVTSFSGIRSVDCSIKSNPALTYIMLSNTAQTTLGGCQWAFQYKKN